jgi:hypothetical protein
MWAGGLLVVAAWRDIDRLKKSCEAWSLEDERALGTSRLVFEELYLCKLSCILLLQIHLHNYILFDHHLCRTLFV